MRAERDRWRRAEVMDLAWPAKWVTSSAKLKSLRKCSWSLPVRAIVSNYAVSYLVVEQAGVYVAVI